MPSHMPSSFASAAAGQASNRDPRGDGRTSGDWSRRDTRANGTLTFRRSSTAPYGVSQQSLSSEASLPPPDASSQPISSGEPAGDRRYDRNQILEIFNKSREQTATEREISQLFMSNWDPGHSSSTNGRGWGKSNDSRDNNHAPDLCWDQSGHMQPIAFEEMSDLERTLFTTDVNSPLKPPPQNVKDQNVQGTGANGRKISVGQGQNDFGLNSPVGRPGTRRRETADSFVGSLASPGANRFTRDEQSPFFTRKLDTKDHFDEKEERDTGGKGAPFGNLMRSNTGTIGSGPSSPWAAGPSGSALPPMGNFGSFALPSPSTATNEKRPGFGSMRGESRLAHLMPKTSTEDMRAEERGPGPDSRSWRARARTDTDPFTESIPRSGSATLGGTQDSPPSQQRGLDTPNRQMSGEFSGDHAGQRADPQQTPQHLGAGEQETQSPTETNPYRSPFGDHRGDIGESDDLGIEEALHARPSQLGMFDQGGNPGFPRPFQPGPFDGSDRSQTSSVGANKGFPSLGSLGGIGGLGGLGGWPTAAPNPIGTPDRDRGFSSAFGNSLFTPINDLQSPGLGGLGSVFGPASTGTIGRGSKLGSLFPAAMQAQMQAHENEADLERPGAFGAIGRSNFGSKEMEGSVRTPLDDLLSRDDSRLPQPNAENASQSAAQTPFSQAPQIPAQSSHQPQISADSSGQLPQAQQRTMVMPDRMRWVYLDPQGNQQGPFSGLEMHDWYKASFFTADLAVKKLEESEFEPLGQLIRRIGNSREPFLVPQIGIPHGIPSGQGPPFGNIQTGAVQPPFPGSFPSFGTTLTAEQQNNLERRKQEEQYLMARQREYLAQQQAALKQMQLSGLPSALHHHSSAHSLQSQPSFGSISSPLSGPPQGPLPGVQSFFDAPAGGRPLPGSGAVPPEFFREEDLAQLSLNERQSLFGGNVPTSQGPPASLASLFQNSDLQREAAQIQQAQGGDPEGFKARLQEFEQLRAQHESEEQAQSPKQAHAAPEPEIKAESEEEERAVFQPHPTVTEQPEQVEKDIPAPQEPETLTLTQQVQKAASAKQSPAVAQPESPWAKVEPGMPLPFPPPQTGSPLPAPTAQRNRSNLPESLTVEPKSRSETPDAGSATASVAPWAKEPSEAPRGPSLKEIQAAEEKKAAQAEAAAMAARRAAQEQEMRNQQVTAPAPGLPTSATWGTSASPAPSSSTVAWAKPTGAKAATPGAANKKTLADIQREEEARKAKLAAAATAAAAANAVAANSTSPSNSSASGKRYAELASKASPAPPVAGGAWSTVGAGGKVKIPTGPAASATPPSRTASGAAVPTVKPVRPVVTTRATTTGIPAASSGANAANDEFIKWAKGALSKGLNTDINVDTFVHLLMTFPLEASLIADSVYANSTLMDGRRFAEEFIRRRKLAEKGIIESASNSAANDSKGGWSEVAKRNPNPPKEESTAGFKVVPSKKKGKK